MKVDRLFNKATKTRAENNHWLKNKVFQNLILIDPALSKVFKKIFEDLFLPWKWRILILISNRECYTLSNFTVTHDS